MTPLSLDDLRANLYEVISLARENRGAEALSPNFSGTRLVRKGTFQGLIGGGAFWMLDGFFDTTRQTDLLAAVLLKTRESLSFHTCQAQAHLKVWNDSKKEAPNQEGEKGGIDYLIDFFYTVRPFSKCCRNQELSERVQGLFQTLFAIAPQEFSEQINGWNSMHADHTILRFTLATGQIPPYEAIKDLVDGGRSDKDPLDPRITQWLTHLFTLPQSLWTPERTEKEFCEKRTVKIAKFLPKLWTLLFPNRPAESHPFKYARFISSLVAHGLKETFPPLFHPGLIELKGEEASFYEVALSPSISYAWNLKAKNKIKGACSQISVKYVSPEGSWYIREKLLGNLAQVIRSDFEKGIEVLRRLLDLQSFFVPLGTLDFSPAYFFVTPKGDVRSDRLLERINCTLKGFDDFIWELSGEDYELYKKIYQHSSVEKTQIGTLIRCVRAQVGSEDLGSKFNKQFLLYEAESLVELNVKKLKLLVTCTKRISSLAPEELERRHRLYWPSIAWQHFPGLRFSLAAPDEYAACLSNLA